METPSILTSLTYILFFLLFPYITFSDDLLTPNFKPNCPSFQCGNLGTIGYPFFTYGILSYCKGQLIDCQRNPPQIVLEGRPYDVKYIFNNKKTIVLHDPHLQNQLDSQACNLSDHSFGSPLPPPSVRFQCITQFLTLYRCSADPIFYKRYTYENCSENYKLLYDYPAQLQSTPNRLFFPNCSVVNLPLIKTPPPEDVWRVNPFALMTAELSLVWDAYCGNCSIHEDLPKKPKTGKLNPDIFGPKPKNNIVPDIKVPSQEFHTPKINKGALGGSVTVVGVLLAGIVAFLTCKKRRKQKPDGEVRI